MLQLVEKSLSSREFMPHGQCFLWQPEILWLHAVSDVLTGVAYYGIPIALVVFAWKRRDLAFRHLFVMSGLFVLACGTTHFMGVWVLWNPDYVAEGVVKAGTAAVSLLSLAAMWQAMPGALALPSPDQLRAANDEMAAEIARRRRAEEQVANLNRELERRIDQRTAELRHANEQLRQRIAREKLLVREIHHRVKNNLQTMSSILKLQEEHAEPALGRHLATAQRRIMAMSKIHEHLYASDEDYYIDIGATIKEIAENTESIYNVHGTVGMETDIEPCTIGMDSANPLALIANEAVTNAFVHGFPGAAGGTIRVELRHLAGAVEFSVADDGVGIGPDRPPRKAGSIGSLMIDALAEQIGASHDVTSNGGTRVTIRFTPEAATHA